MLINSDIKNGLVLNTLIDYKLPLCKMKMLQLQVVNQQKINLKLNFERKIEEKHHYIIHIPFYFFNSYFQKLL